MTRFRQHLRVCLLLLAGLQPIVGSKARAQRPETGLIPLVPICGHDVTAESPAERLLSVLVSQRDVARPLIAPMSPPEIAALHDHEPATSGSCSNPALPAEVLIWYNAGTANTALDGAVWQGRGVTISASAGFARQWSVVSVSIRPQVSFSENRRWTPSGASEGDNRNPDWPNDIDFPYRMGNGAYHSVALGESYIRADGKGVGIGVSTASQRWGPARFYPLLIGAEGPGIPRVFVEARSIRTPIGSLSGQWQMGWLEASIDSPLLSGERSRLSPAAILTFSPRGLSALTVGGSRFFHVRRAPGTLGWTTASLPFTGLLKSGSVDAEVGGYNQLATAMVQIAHRNLSVYGELMRDDHNADVRDAVGEPDHISAWVLGAEHRRVAAGQVSIFKFERANGRISHLRRVRPQAPVYVHSSIREGHTYLGQPLGSSALLGGGGISLSFEYARRSFAREIAIEMGTLRQNAEGGTWNGEISETLKVRAGHRAMTGAGLVGLELSTQFAGAIPFNASIAFKWNR